MITEFQIENFRSIQDQTIPVKKLNILYGPNGSGKSSVLYSPYIARNFFTRPNQELDKLFNLGFINLGGYENIINDDSFLNFKISITNNAFRPPHGNKDLKKIKYTLSISNKFTSTIKFEINNEVSDFVKIEIPFVPTSSKIFSIIGRKFRWNGLTFEISDEHSYSDIFLVEQLNSIYADIKALEIISVKRGFFSPIFSSEFNPDEASFALQIRDEGLDFELKIDKYFNSIFEKNFRFVAIPGSTSFYLRTHSKNGRATDLVNEGFGINQTIYMLIKLLKKSTGLALIEEPEIHLHPTAQSKLMDAFCDIVQRENKQIFLTTHSENIVSSVLRKITDGEIKNEDVQFLLASNENGETKITPQEVNDKGQIEGGLMNFMEVELNNLKTILGL